MTLPSDVIKIANIRGPRGATGAIGGATVAMIPAGAEPSIVIREAGDITFADFFIPRGLPGVNAVPADNAVATYATTQGTATRSALRSFLLPRSEVAATVADLVSGSGPVRDALREGFVQSGAIATDGLRIGFFGKTPVGRQPNIQFTDATTPSLQDRVNKIIDTLVAYGLIPANS